MTKFLDHSSVDKHTKMRNYGINIIMWLDAETYRNVSKVLHFFVFCVFMNRSWAQENLVKIKIL